MNNPEKDRTPAAQFKTNGRVLTLTVGPPASGKSTFARAAGFDVAVCLDDFRESLWGDRRIQDGPGGTEALLVLQDAVISAAMQESKSIIVHNTNIFRQYRMPIVELAKKHGYRTQIVYFDIPADACRQRNRLREDRVPEAVMDSFFANTEPPARDEADLVVRFSELNAGQPTALS